MKIKDWMSTRLVTVRPTTSVREAFLLMRKNNIRHLPVVVDGQVAGIVTDRDLRRPKDVGFEEEYQIREDLLVEEAMIGEVRTVTPETDLVSAAAVIVKEKIGSFLVLDRGKLVGIITQHDFLRALVHSVARSASKTT